MNVVRRTLAPVFSAALLLSGLAVAGAPTAQAAGTDGVYIVTPKWWGWCPDVRVKNSVAAISLTNLTTGYSGNAVTDVAWARVNVGQNNKISVNVGCSLGHGSTGTTITIKPNRHKQTFWISPTGATYGN